MLWNGSCSRTRPAKRSPSKATIAGGHPLKLLGDTREEVPEPEVLALSYFWAPAELDGTVVRPRVICVARVGDHERGPDQRLLR
jgi:hypothetical protein